MGAEVDRGFEKLIETIMEHEAAVAEAGAEQSKPRPWMNFSSSTMKTPVEEKSEEKLHDSLSRDDVEEKYVTAMNNEESRSNELIMPKVQGDFLASVERDKRMQWRGRIRMAAHKATRSRGFGVTNGAVWRRTLDYFSRIILKAEEFQRGS